MYFLGIPGIDRYDHARTLHFLLKLCSVCGDYVSCTRSTAPLYCCITYASELMMVFGINIATDSPDSHDPASLCYLCHQVVTKYKDALAWYSVQSVHITFDTCESTWRRLLLCA